MREQPPRQAERAARERSLPTVSALLDDGTIVEMVYRPEERRSAFILWDGLGSREERDIRLDPFHRLVPYSPHNNLIRNEIVLLPSGPEDYGTEAQLLAEIRAFIHRYVDVSPLFETISAYYVLLTWVYDAFNELPYLRLRGDPGTGKTRYLLAVGSLCYKPIFASGASTVSPLFRMLDAFRGTLIIDEGDFRFSDNTAEVTKILNNGNVRGFPVLRSEASGTREFNPHAYAVFGPKLVATRGFFQDRALESRFLTEETGQSRLREDIPISMPGAQKAEALQLRNKLLLFRFRHLRKQRIDEQLVDRTIEPRLNQIFLPLLSIIEDTRTRAELLDLARRYNQEFTAERGMDMEAQVLEVIRDMRSLPSEAVLSVKEITDRFADRHGQEFDRKINPKWIGGIIRKRLHLRTQKSHGVFVIPPGEWAKLPRLYERYGVTAEAGPDGGAEAEADG